jgi:hypothetical protein
MKEILNPYTYQQSKAVCLFVQTKGPANGVPFVE